MELITNKDSTSNSQSATALQQLVEFTWKATRGLVDETGTQVNQAIDKLSTAGRLSAEERTKLSAFVQQRLTDSRKKFLQDIDQHVQTAAEKISTLTRGEVEKLQKEIVRLEQKINQLSA